jgi:hypothetical protein
MEKLTKLVSYLPEIAFIALTVRCLMMGTGIGESIAFISLVGSMVYRSYLNRSKIDRLDEMDKKYEALASKVQSLSMDRAMRRSVNEPQAQATTAPRRIF